jgi:sulfur relay (sulfurtransferase) DsrC/TusE family protein
VDLLAELENMASTLLTSQILMLKPKLKPLKGSNSFSSIYAEATKHIKQHRANLSRTNVSNEHWEIVRHEKEAKGFNREAYEYSITPGKRIKKTLAAGLSPSHESSTFLLKLEGPLETAVSVQKAAGLASAPAVLSGTGDAGNEASFCRVDGAAKKSILDSLSTASFQPTFIRVSKAEKALSNTSPYPTLGMESTLPQHRPTTIDSTSTSLLLRIGCE